MFYMICDFIVIRNSLFFMTIVISEMFLYFSRYFSTTCFQIGNYRKGLGHFFFSDVFRTDFLKSRGSLPFRKFKCISFALATGSINGVSQLLLVWNLVLVLLLVRICWYNQIQFHHFFQVKIWFYVSELNILDDHKCFFMLVKYVPFAFPCLLCCEMESCC